MDDPIIQNRILSLDPSYQEFVMSDFISTASHELAAVGELSEQDRIILSNGLLLYMLYFLTSDSLIGFLVDNDFDPSQAAALVGAYKEILPPEFVEEHDDVVIELTDDSDNSDEDEEEDEDDETIPTANVPFMPVATDSAGVNTYASSQSSVLTPNTPPSEAPKWGQL